jgi:hypothetical protein
MIERTSSAASGRRAPVFICLAFYLLAAYRISFVQSATVAQTHAQHMQDHLFTNRRGIQAGSHIFATRSHTHQQKC